MGPALHAHASPLPPWGTQPQSLYHFTNASGFPQKPLGSMIVRGVRAAGSALLDLLIIQCSASESNKNYTRNVGVGLPFGGWGRVRFCFSSASERKGGGEPLQFFY